MDDTAERLVRVETKIDALINLNDVRMNALENRVSEIDKAFANKLEAVRVENHKDNARLEANVTTVRDQLSWGVRIVLTIVITAVLGAAGIVATRHPIERTIPTQTQS